MSGNGLSGVLPDCEISRLMCFAKVYFGDEGRNNKQCSSSTTVMTTAARPDAATLVINCQEASDMTGVRQLLFGSFGPCINSSVLKVMSCHIHFFIFFSLLSLEFADTRESCLVPLHVSYIRNLHGATRGQELHRVPLLKLPRCLPQQGHGLYSGLWFSDSEVWNEYASLFVSVQ